MNSFYVHNEQKIIFFYLKKKEIKKTGVCFEQHKLCSQLKILTRNFLHKG